MTNQEIHQKLKYFKSLRAAAACTGNRAEGQRCSDIIELLSGYIVAGAYKQ
ncbi:MULTISPECIES: hypothetical protein [unclassified Pseudomonas]|uniref:hypothetical protein n=1 Tax=unclassified Pseudomonas TaxID=196821 RepID=UPI001304E16D|nr:MULTISPECIES: hypothetical protein [unclassified Pseudomonas]